MSRLDEPQLLLVLLRGKRELRLQGLFLVLERPELLAQALLGELVLLEGPVLRPERFRALVGALFAP